MRLKKRSVMFCLIFILLTPTMSDVMGSLPDEKIPRFPSVAPPETMADQDITVVRGTVRPGDAISAILDPHLPLKTVYRLNRESRPLFSLQRIRPGNPYKIFLLSGRMTRFEYMISPAERLVIREENGAFSIVREPVACTLVPTLISGSISTCLYQAVVDANEGGILASRLSEIFAWDIDPARDIRPGDEFRMIVEKRFRQGKFIGYGQILAAGFRCRGVSYQAFFHRGTDGGRGHYDGNGRSLKKAFLKAPLTYSRITSGFSLKRMHPILKEFRSHPAVDYAAPSGTPVKTVGDGVVSGLGYSRTMGNHVTVRHASGYKTRYFHLKGFAHGMARGKQIRQGEIIGFVGQTGYATGPHLCFRMTKNGRPVDPLTLTMSSAAPVPPDEMAGFLARAGQLENEMAAHTLAQGKRL